MFKLPSDFSWLPPWSPLDDDHDAVELADELRREISHSHVLADCEFIAVGESERYDDFLFVTNSAAKPIAFVHLTWKQERDPTWPFTVIYRSLDEWISEMTKDNAEFLLDLEEDAG